MTSDVGALGPEIPKVADTPKKFSKVNQEVTIETSVPEDLNVNMDVKTASPQSKDGEEEDSTGHHLKKM